MHAHKFTVGVDWGSSSFRAYRFALNGDVTERVESTDGIKTVANAEFESVLLSHIGQWLQPGDSVLLSGMITSRNGWVETPYIRCPLILSELLQSAASTSISNDVTLFFLPGACVNQPADVMRGEELQLYGAVQHDKQLVVLPGTHSKWAVVNGGVLEKFHTVVTGELFEALMNHTLVGGLATAREHLDQAFEEGVKKGFATEAIISQLFTARSGVLLGQLEGDEVSSYLSGLLIGNEIRESRLMSDTPVLIVGSDILTARYSQAFDLLDKKYVTESHDAAELGFQKLIKQLDS